jgi:SAM-dependent methyltransferase
MPRSGELTYYEVIGELGRRYAINKPFSDEKRGLYLMQVGAVLSLLPPAPARVLECGCGTGWFSYLLAKSGYEVVGADVSSHAIELARENPMFFDSASPDFVVMDWEELDYDCEFDAVIFFDALHHSLDEQAAINAAYQALCPGGVLIASETGVGHQAASRGVSEKYDVTEKDMPPKRIIDLAKQAGFQRWTVHPRGDYIGKYLYDKPSSRWKRAVVSSGLGRYLVILYHLLFGKRDFGLVVLQK